MALQETSIRVGAGSHVCFSALFSKWHYLPQELEAMRARLKAMEEEAAKLAKGKDAPVRNIATIIVAMSLRAIGTTSADLRLLSLVLVLVVFVPSQLNIVDQPRAVCCSAPPHGKQHT